MLVTKLVSRRLSNDDKASLTFRQCAKAHQLPLVVGSKCRLRFPKTKGLELQWN